MTTSQLTKNQPILTVGPQKCKNCQADLISQASITIPPPRLQITIPIRPGNLILHCPFCDKKRAPESSSEVRRSMGGSQLNYTRTAVPKQATPHQPLTTNH